MDASTVFARRLDTLWNGMIRVWATGAGQRHPEIAWQMAIDALITRVEQLRPLLASQATRFEILCDQLQQGLTELNAVLADLPVATGAGDEALAQVLNHRRRTLTASLEAIRRSRDETANELAGTGEALRRIEAERVALATQGESIVNLMPETAPRLMERLRSLSFGAELKLLARIRRLSRRPCTFPIGCDSCQAANESDHPALHHERDLPAATPGRSRSRSA